MGLDLLCEGVFVGEGGALGVLLVAALCLIVVTILCF